MKQEDKELLLRDLCARLPYGIKIKTSYDKMDEPIELRFINPRNESFAIGGDFTLISGLDFNKYECKPYLFPLSSMTEEQKKFFKDRPIFLDFENELVVKEDFFGNSRFTMLDDWMEVINWCYENHFDINGLIPKKLAINCINLNIY